MIKEAIISGALAAALALPATAPLAHAGTLTIHNENCTKNIGFKKRKRVTVHVWGQEECDTDKKVTIDQGESKTIELDDHFKTSGSVYEEGVVKECKYGHEAMGTVSFKHDVAGSQDSHVTCKKDRIGVCQCRKD